MGKALIVVGVVAALGVGFLALGASESAKHQAQTSTEGLAVRSSFHIKILGKTPDEVKQLVGPPSYTQSTGGKDIWYYDRKTYDLETGRPDSSAQVVFDDYGVVKTVNFH